MYEYLDGQVAGRSAARLVLDVNGIGFELAVPLLAPFPAGGRMRAWTHFVVREDAHKLYGFHDKRTRDLFRALLDVRGVGPGIALTLLSGLTAEELLAAIAAGDADKLCAVRGIGKRTAGQILLDLGHRAAELAAATGAALASAQGDVLVPQRRAQQVVEDAVSALVSIGYAESEARKAVGRAAKGSRAADLEHLVRAAIQGGS